MLRHMLTQWLWLCSWTSRLSTGMPALAARMTSKCTLLRVTMSYSCGTRLALLLSCSGQNLQVTLFPQYEIFLLNSVKDWCSIHNLVGLVSILGFGRSRSNSAFVYQNKTWCISTISRMLFLHPFVASLPLVGHVLRERIVKRWCLPSSVGVVVLLQCKTLGFWVCRSTWIVPALTCVQLSSLVQNLTKETIF